MFGTRSSGNGPARRRSPWSSAAGGSVVLALAVASTLAEPLTAVAAPATPGGLVTAYAAVGGPQPGAGGTVVSFDPRDGAIRWTIAVGGQPTAIAVTPDAGRILVTNALGYLSVIDAQSQQQVQVQTCPSSNAVAVAPNGRIAVVTCPDASAVDIVDLATESLTSTIVVGQYPGLPSSVAIDPAGSIAYVVNFNGSSPSDNTGTVVPVELRSGRTLPPIRLSGTEAIGAAITPDGRRLLVGVWGTTTTGSALDVVSTATRAVVAVRSVPTGPNSVAVAADGATAYVASALANTITALGLGSRGGSSQRTGIGTSAVAVTPDQATLLSASGRSGQEVDMLNLPALEVRGYVATSHGPVAVAVAPDQAPRASLRRTGGTGRSLTLDASSSMSPSSPIARYAWDFGDGTRSTTTTPTVSHTYRRPGRYQATVTLTDSAGTSLTQVFTGQTVSRNGGPAARARLDVTVTR